MSCVLCPLISFCNFISFVNCQTCINPEMWILGHWVDLVRLFPHTSKFEDI